ncbi:PH domain-containing protein [Mariniluteicoccus flavus]
MPDAHDALFAPPGVAWRPISPRWRDLKRVSTPLSWLIVFAIPAVTLWLITADWRWTAPFVVAGLALAVWRCLAMGALWRSWGYAELDDDLWVTRGVMFRRLTAVPYGRMQVVEVESGPLERALGLATVKLVTASSSTDATIPGLPPDEAAALRDRLTERAETRTSGL